MVTVLLVLVVVAVVAALVFGVVTLLSGDDPGLSTADPDSWAHPLPRERSLTEGDLRTVRFDVTLMGYRMGQVDRMLRRTGYDIGYKDEMIAVLEAEVAALREGRLEDAELLRKAREAAATPAIPAEPFGGSEAESEREPDPDAELDAGPRAIELDEETDGRREGSLAWRPKETSPGDVLQSRLHSASAEESVERSRRA